ncbi:hypothetical protein CRG98_050283 [Punica granatum]|uniref:Extensin-like n=1 Tax=Punica granatum TaxID=22663 RepID=A0A2I0GK31_PUNGR|nr:hypothetical protein CRG98_050283 [Punica granatum]
MAEENRINVLEEVTPPIPAHSQPPLTHALPPPTPTGTPPAYSSAPSVYLPPPTPSGTPLTYSGAPPPQVLPPVMQASSASNDHPRLAALEGTVNQLAANMTTNMAELFALLRGPNRAFSSSTPPLGQGPTVYPTSWIPPTHAPESVDAPALPTTHAPTVYLFTISLPPLPSPYNHPSSTDGFPDFGPDHVCTAACFHAGPGSDLYCSPADGLPGVDDLCSRSHHRILPFLDLATEYLLGIGVCPRGNL